MTPIQFIDFFMDFGYEFRHKRHQSDLEFFVLDTHVGASCRLNKVPRYDVRLVVFKSCFRNPRCFDLCKETNNVIQGVPY